MTSRSIPSHPPGARERSSWLARPRVAIDALLFHAAGIVAGLVALAVWVTSVTVGLVLAITVVAAPVTLAAFRALRAFTAMERRRALLVDPVPIAGPPAPSGAPSARARWKDTIRDRNSWRDLAWAVVSSGVSVALGVAVVAAWAAVAYLITLPLWFWAPPASSGVPSVGVAIDSAPRAVLACVVGLVLLPVAGLIGIALARLEVRAMRATLTPSPGDPVGAGAPDARARASGDRAGDDAGRVASLTTREREVLGLMADGMSNAAIASELVITEGAVEKHVANIFAKLDLPPSSMDHRRVLAVRRYLEADGEAPARP